MKSIISLCLVLSIGLIGANAQSNKTINTMDKNALEKDNRAKLSGTVFVWLHSDIPHDLTYRYWRDVHGVSAARVPGFYMYRQLHFRAPDTTLLKDLAHLGLDVVPDQKLQPQGISHIMFATQEDLTMYSTNPFFVDWISQDEPFLGPRNAFVWSTSDASKTYVDRRNITDQNGVSKFPRFAVTFRKAPSVSIEEFRTFIIESFAKEWSQKDEVLRVRLELLDTYNPTPSFSDKVSHEWGEDEQYQAWIDLELDKGVELSSIFSKTDEYSKYLSAVHAYPVPEVYTIVYEEIPTLVGLRGYPAVQIIEEAGAAVQKDIRLLEQVYGPIVHGAKPMWENQEKKK